MKRFADLLRLLDESSVPAAREGARVALAARNAEGDRTEARLLVARILMHLGRHGEALEELRRTMQADPITPEVHRDLAFAAARAGDEATALAGWDHYRRSMPDAPDLALVTEAEQLLRRLREVTEAVLRG